MTIPNGSKPDLVLYYSLILPSTTINKTIDGINIIQTANGFLFADKEYQQKIGDFAFVLNIFDTVKINKNDEYQTVGTNVYFLPEGTISNSINLQFTKDSNGFFVVKPNQTNVYQILTGSGNFLNYPGFVVQITNEDFGREIQIYFNK